MNRKYGFPSYFPEILLEKAVDLKEIGIYNYAWKSDESIATVEFLANNGFIILGGDVFSLNNEVIESTGDSWYFESENIREKATIDESKEQAVSYIEKYAKKNTDEEYIYSIVFEASK
ncbi:hypothetical protein MSSIT_1753 [Methanosarcina siciliae T4/M]|uniref:Immunity protein 40 domain-containing protein n=2 Tax=Methanosarcina siciliae TaxID=38027 RepID=A0A0E3PE54_9EURY|nr:Imm40 family immunity protein [Methanosarcina siciliae]AKB28472.1 hypothetical protein MSSIT_1753 [Methanosarcina siciliae T4/M]AKB32379.1 hypothetical protein MSSIH_1689 [Methanosarcina siciliae HI350]